MFAADFLPDIQSIQSGYKSGAFSPRELVAHLYEKASRYQDRNIWIKRFTLEELEPFLAEADQALANNAYEDLCEEQPLFGIPFAIKDNIEMAGFETTAACPEFSFQPEKHAFVVEQLLNAGAIALGKTNLDQFATGLVGTRSPEPWGPCRNAINPDYISGGSSSGSAVAVALGLVTFSLGTDTAGSGRVPAMLNNIVGLKPTKGVFSTSGVVPACRSLDCPSVFAFTVSDAEKVFSVAAAYDEQDSYARPNPFSNSHRYFGQPDRPPVIGVPFLDEDGLDKGAGQLQFFGEADAKELYMAAIDTWRSLGAEIVEIDFEPLLAAARLLYEGPWVAERYAAIESLIESNPEAIHPVVRDIVQTATSKTAVEGFKAEYQMQAYRAHAARLFDDLDFMLTPTAPRAYLLEELLADPIKLNSNMGYYTNYMNLLDLSGLAVPAGFMSNGMPFGITMIGNKFDDQKLLSYATEWEKTLDLPAGATDIKASPTEALAPVQFQDHIQVAVCGAHLRGMPLNWQLVERGASFVEATKTSANYRFYALAAQVPAKPGLIREQNSGYSVDVEVWAVPASEFGSFVAGIPHPLGIGKVELADGRWVSSFICESEGIEGAKDISAIGSWAGYIEQSGL